MAAAGLSSASLARSFTVKVLGAVTVKGALAELAAGVALSVTVMLPPPMAAPSGSATVQPLGSAPLLLVVQPAAQLRGVVAEAESVKLALSAVVGAKPLPVMVKLAPATP